jgi:hypothetical protein
LNHSAIVTFDSERIECRRSSGLVEGVSWDDLQTVGIRTTADGPFGVDLLWVLTGKAGGCIIPAEADGEREMLNRLQKLPGFDNLVFIEAMSCVEERSFVCWERITQG